MILKKTFALGVYSLSIHLLTSMYRSWKSINMVRIILLKTSFTTIPMKYEHYDHFKLKRVAYSLLLIYNQSIR